VPEPVLYRKPQAETSGFPRVKATSSADHGFCSRPTTPRKRDPVFLTSLFFSRVFVTVPFLDRSSTIQILWHLGISSV